MWQLITGADVRRECWSTIADIEAALGGHIESGGCLSPHLAAGTAGLALFFAYLHAADGSDTAADRVIEMLDLSGSALARGPMLPALYSGFTGVGWVVTHLTRELFEGDGDLALEVDEALRELLSDITEPPPFELVTGLAGFGSYLVERLPHRGAAELLVRVVDIFDASRDATGTWFTNPDWLPGWQRDLTPQGYHNAGVAHGIPGVIGFLASAQRAGFSDPRLPRLAGDAVQWLLGQKGGWSTSIFPAHIPPGAEPRPTRTAWCYGDLGVATVLLSAGRAFAHPEWEAEAIAIARIAARRTVEETRASDVCLCHGTAGIAHLFNRIYQATGEIELRRAALAWYRNTLNMRRPGQGMAGFLTWVETGLPDEGAWKSEAGFLCGIAGVGLALLAAVSDVEPAWDRVMVVS